MGSEGGRKAALEGRSGGEEMGSEGGLCKAALGGRSGGEETGASDSAAELPLPPSPASACFEHEAQAHDEPGG